NLTGLTITGGAIIGAGDIGLDVFSSGVITGGNPPSVTGGASYGLRATTRMLKVFAPDSATTARYAGNFRDSIYVNGNNVIGDTVPFNAALPYRVHFGFDVDSNAVMIVQPGARLAY